MEKKMNSDGNCLFRAVADQILGNQDFHMNVRKRVVQWLLENQSVPIDFSGGRLEDFLDRKEFPTWKDYCQYMATDGSWGDHIALTAISEEFRTRIYIVSSILTKSISGSLFHILDIADLFISHRGGRCHLDSIQSNVRLKEQFIYHTGMNGTIILCVLLKESNNRSIFKPKVLNTVAYAKKTN